MLDIALTSIFYYKSSFWLVVSNFSVYSFRSILQKRYKVTFVISLLITIFYFVVGNIIDEKCAFNYYIVFHNQSVMEEYTQEPILKAGYQIGPILTRNIIDKEMKFRREAIGGLEKIKYQPATPWLTKILYDKSEIIVIRTDAYQALTTFDTEETQKILIDFKNQATDSLDKKVVELGEYFLKHR